MKRQLIFTLLFIVVFVTNSIGGIPRQINYQGKLLDKNNEQPVPEGVYKLTFKIYNEADNLLWTEVHNSVFIADGLFNVMLGDNTPLNLDFNQQYFLGIQINEDPELVPRINLSASPYAFMAADAENVSGLPASSTPKPGFLLPLNNKGKFPASVIPGTSGGNYIKKGEADTSRANESIPLLLVSNLGNGTGFDGRSVGGVGISGRSDKNEGIVGWTGNQGKSGVFGYSAEGKGITGRSDKDDGVVGWTGAGNKSGVFGHTNATNGVGVSGHAVVTDATAIVARNIPTGNYAELASGDFGLEVGGLAHFNLPSGQINISTPGGWPGIIAFSPNGHRRDIIVGDDKIRFLVGSSSSPPTSNSGIIIMENGNVGIGIADPDKKLVVDGIIKATALQLTGGSDIAEPFNIDELNTIEAGMVVIIDPDNPGKLKISDKSYDRKVAGIVSGAGGVQPGMIMAQQGSIADGSTPVALSGRVYCLVDASDNPVESGDLLTTSNTPGHAMKVTDYNKAQGAIIGKAMSSLDNGKGLVLVLVSLQ